MKVILKQDVSNLGKRFDVVDVKDGYAIHFLFPKKLAAPLTKKSLQDRDLFLKKQQEHYEINKALSHKLKEVIEQTELHFSLKEHNGRPYGSIITKQIINQAHTKGMALQKFMFKENVRLGFGDHEITLHIFEDTTAVLKVKVTPDNGVK
ncbi:50S ribosomal protein L9 [Mycoplasmoides pneumoniae]|uniref:50S ribosomal protein L9 n=1 Tax=Mycoplasmoides pneumoniae TaxID=2104 RepID=UPI0013304019|nr:50S ribosomal protein L9 [Mycoplasmoides pneumoniae]